VLRHDSRQSLAALVGGRYGQDAGPRVLWRIDWMFGGMAAFDPVGEGESWFAGFDSWVFGAE
jgi:hypothetical protein